MRATRTTELRFLRTTITTTTREELVQALDGVPDSATITVTVDTPRNPTPLDPGGTVTIRATWEDES